MHHARAQLRTETEQKALWCCSTQRRTTLNDDHRVWDSTVLSRRAGRVRLVKRLYRVKCDAMRTIIKYERKRILISFLHINNCIDNFNRCSARILCAPSADVQKSTESRTADTSNVWPMICRSNTGTEWMAFIFLDGRGKCMRPTELWTNITQVEREREIARNQNEKGKWTRNSPPQRLHSFDQSLSDRRHADTVVFGAHNSILSVMTGCAYACIEPFACDDWVNPECRTDVKWHCNFGWMHSCRQWC